MQAHQRFIDILEKQLSEAADAQCGQAGTESRVATPAFWGVPENAFSPSRLRTHLRAHRPQLSHVSVIQDGRAATSACTTPPRRLTTTQRDALRQLQRLGAVDLDQSFSDHQLRHIFRALAKRFHPDRHPESSSMERERLTRAFATVVDAYRALTSAAGQAVPAANHQ